MEGGAPAPSPRCWSPGSRVGSRRARRLAGRTSGRTLAWPIAQEVGWGRNLIDLARGDALGGFAQSPSLHSTAFVRQPAEEDSPGTLNIGGKDTWSVIARFAF